MSLHLELARRLHDARTNARPTPHLTLEHPLTVEDAYAVQHELVELSKPFSGWTMGLTSGAKQREVGVDSTICGRLLAADEIANGGTVARAKFIHPRAEPEIVFFVDEPLQPFFDLARIRRCISHVAIGIEVIDSRYQDFKFTLPDVVADNCSAAGYVLGDMIEAPFEALQTMGFWMRRNGVVVTTGAGAAILGDPLRSIHELLRLTKVRIDRGPVLAGAVTGSVPFAAGDWIEVECGPGARASFRAV